MCWYLQVVSKKFDKNHPYLFGTDFWYAVVLKKAIKFSFYTTVYSIVSKF